MFGKYLYDYLIGISLIMGYFIEEKHPEVKR